MLAGPLTSSFRIQFGRKIYYLENPASYFGNQKVMIVKFLAKNALKRS